MGIKKIARPINKAKNDFVKWLKDNDADNIDVFEGAPSTQWDYYRCVSGFVGESLYTVCFMMWNGEVKIDYSDEGNRYVNMGIDDFRLLLN